MSSTSMSPNHREVLSARSTVTGKQEYLTSTSGVLNVNSGGSGTLSAVYNAVAPVLSDGQTSPLQLDQSGRLYTNQAPLTYTGDSVQAYMFDGSGNALTSNTGTSPGGFALDSNISRILNVAPTTPGFLDVKGADGNVFVRQSTASNLQTTTRLNDGSGNSISSTGGALNVNISSGSSSDVQYQELATTSPATGTLALGRYQSSAPTLTNGQMNEPMLDSSSRLLVNGSGVTQPVSGTITANAGTNLNTSALALETGGNLATIASNTTGLATSSNQTNGTQQSKITDGTNIANVIAGDSGFNGLAINSATKTITFTTSSSGAQTILANTNVEGYSWIEIVYTSVGSGLALTGQYSTTSGGTYVNSSTFASTGATSAPTALGTVVNTIYGGPIHGNYFQIAVSALTSGTFAGSVTLRALPPPFQTITAVSTGTTTVAGNKTNNNAAPGATNVGSLGVIANAATPTWTEGNLVALSAGLKGYIRVNAGLMPSDTELNTYSVHISSNTTTTPTSSTAYISSISISNEVAGTTSSITIQDKQGTPLKLINGFSTTALTTVPTVINFQTPVKMVSGIDIVTSGAVAATVDVWVNYYQ